MNLFVNYNEENNYNNSNDNEHDYNKDVDDADKSVTDDIDAHIRM